jgi:hypothetical protein
VIWLSFSRKNNQWGKGWVYERLIDGSQGKLIYDSKLGFLK